MDREFMRLFCRKYYSDYQMEAVEESGEYQSRKNKRYELEQNFELELQKYEGLYGLFEKYLDACADEQEVLMEEIYLMGAQDREKMLRGII